MHNPEINRDNLFLYLSDINGQTPRLSDYDVYRYYRKMKYTHGELKTAGIACKEFQDRYDQENKCKEVEP